MLRGKNFHRERSCHEGSQNHHDRGRGPPARRRRHARAIARRPDPAQWLVRGAHRRSPGRRGQGGRSRATPGHGDDAEARHRHLARGDRRDPGPGPAGPGGRLDHGPLRRGRRARQDRDAGPGDRDAGPLTPASVCVSGAARRRSETAGLAPRRGGHAMTRFTAMFGAAMLMTSTVMVVESALAPQGFAQGQPYPLQPSSPRINRLVRAPGVIEGTLTRVDGRTESVDVSIFLGLLGKTLEISRDTLIQVNGREARFADLQEGAKVKAFYEERGAKLVATRLEVLTAPG